MSFQDKLKEAVDTVDFELDRCMMYTETNYQNALIHCLNDLLTNTAVCREVHISYRLSDGYIFGSGRADIICEQEEVVYILELKVSCDSKYLKKYCGQTQRYIKHYITSKKKVGILILFNCGSSPFIKVLPWKI